jgi:hypothetical protein
MSTNPLPLNPVVAELVAEVTRLRNQVRVVFRSSVFCVPDTLAVLGRSQPSDCERFRSLCSVPLSGDR